MPSPRAAETQKCHLLDHGYMSPLLYVRYYKLSVNVDFKTFKNCVLSLRNFSTDIRSIRPLLVQILVQRTRKPSKYILR